MITDFTETLKRYASRKFNHKLLLEAASDPLLPTADLFVNAISIIELERSGIEVKETMTNNSITIQTLLFFAARSATKEFLVEFFAKNSSPKDSSKAFKMNN